MSITTQRQQLKRDLSKGVLRNHAEGILHEVYIDAVEAAAIETNLPHSVFPTQCAYTLEELLAFVPETQDNLD